MTDDLVKRLRDHIAVSFDDRGHVFEDEVLCDDAADRIEELEAKLAKAMEHFKKLRRRQDCLETYDAVVDEVVETALTELKGGKDE